MILGTGVDIVEIGRIERLLDREPFLAKVFAEAEVEACRREGFSRKRTTLRLAGLFAAKEAVMKALATGWTRGASFREIVVTHTEAGKPLANLEGGTKAIGDALGVENVLLSISHCDHFAVAFAILEGNHPQ